MATFILSIIAAAALRGAGWPWGWAIVTGIGVGFVVTTVGGYLLMAVLGISTRRAERRLHDND